MVQASSCQRCGTTTDAESLDGLCGRCLATIAFAPEPEEHDSELKGQILARFDKTIALDTPALDTGSAAVTRFGDYELISEIARGGMGVVYKARQVSLNRIVAVKMILHGRFSNPQFVRRFRAEAEAAANLRHPNIVGIYEIGEHDGQHYFSMEYVEGYDLQFFVNEPLPPERTAQRIKTIAEAIHYAHQHGILHRDLKPSNVLVDLNGEVRITDFGLAKRVPGTEGSSIGSRLGSTALAGTGEFDVTASGQILGSPGYMSPEQADGRSRDVDVRSDVYAVGAILYALLTGRPPFIADTIEGALRQILQAEPVSLRLLNPRVPKDLETICLKCLQKEPERRYASAKDMADELGRFLGGESIHARPVGAPEKVWRWCKRKPVVAALGATTSVMLAAIAIGSPVAIFRIDRSRQEAETNLQLARQTSYATEVLFAAEEIEAENRGQAMELLNRSRPKAGETDFRSWEWRFLWAQCRSAELFTVGTHNQEIYRVAFLPDGRLVCGDFGETVKIWDPKTKTALASERVGPISDLEISPDGSVIGAAYWAADFAFLDATNLKKKGTARFRKKVYHLAFSPRDKVFATAGPDHVALWSFTLPSPSLVWTQAFRDVTGLSFAPDGETFAFATKDQHIFIYDAATREMQRTMPARGEPSEVVFSPDGKRLAVAHWNGVVAIYDPATGDEIAMLTNHTMWVASLAFSRTDPILATSSADQRIRLWNTTTWRETASFKGHLSLVDSVAVSPDGRWLASGSKDRSVRIWNLETKAISEASQTFTNILGSAMSPKAEFVAMVNSDATLSVWDLIGQREVKRFPVETGTVVLAISPLGDAVVLGNKSHKVWLHRLAAPNGDIQVEGADAGKAVAAFSPDGSRFAGSGKLELLRVGATDGSTPVRVLEHPIDQTTDILFSQDGRQIFLANESGMVRACDAATGEKVVYFRAHDHVTAGIAFDVDGRRLATTSADGTVGLWDLATRRKLDSYGKSSLGYRSVSFSRDGKRIAASSGEGPVKVWDIASGREVARFKYTEPVSSIRFAADDRTLVIATANRLTLFRAPTFTEINAAEATVFKNP